MSTFQLAQLNIAKMQAPKDDPVMHEFVANLDRINALAESSPAYVWRLQDDTDKATATTVFNDETLLLNLSVWESIDSLKQFVYQTQHAEFIRRKQEWFRRLTDRQLVLWWVKAGKMPTVIEAQDRLLYLRKNGETAYAFSFKKVFNATPKYLQLPHMHRLQP